MGDCAFKGLIGAAVLSGPADPGVLHAPGTRLTGGFHTTFSANVPWSARSRVQLPCAKTMRSAGRHALNAAGGAEIVDFAQWGR